MGRDMGPILEQASKRDIQLEQMREMLKVQGQDGNWNYSPYMLGLYNGMEFMLSMAEDREPEFRERPEKWIANNPETFEDPIAQQEIDEGIAS